MNVRLLILLVLMQAACGNQAPYESPVGAVTPEKRSIILEWSAPTINTDESELLGLAGHIVYIDEGKGFVQLQTITDPKIATYRVDNLEPGTYTFSITAFNQEGEESDHSNQVNVVTE